MTKTLPASALVAGLVAAVAMLALAAGAADAQTLFRSPTLGFTRSTPPRTAPPLAPPGAIRSAPPLTPQPFDANQCQLLSGTCPLGRLQRSGSRCYCVSAPGTARQGGSQVKPQGANPSAQ